MSYIPRNARLILGSPKLQREFFLKPYGLDIPKNQYYPRKHPQYKFVDHKLVLRRPGKQVEPNVLTFRTDPNLSKPELKQFIEKLYRFKVDKINTARFQGKVQRKQYEGYQKAQDWKKVFVVTSKKIDPSLNKKQ